MREQLNFIIWECKCHSDSKNITADSLVIARVAQEYLECDKDLARKDSEEVALRQRRRKLRSVSAWSRYLTEHFRNNGQDVSRPQLMRQWIPRNVHINNKFDDKNLKQPPLGCTILKSNINVIGDGSEHPIRHHAPGDCNPNIFIALFTFHLAPCYTFSPIFKYLYTFIPRTKSPEYFREASFSLNPGRP